MEDGGVDLVQPGGQGVLVVFAVKDASDGGNQRRPVLALGELGKVRRQALGGGLVVPAGGDHGADGWLPPRQEPLDVEGGVGELSGEFEDRVHGLVAAGSAPREPLEEIAEADAEAPGSCGASGSDLQAHTGTGGSPGGPGRPSYPRCPRTIATSSTSISASGWDNRLTSTFVLDGGSSVL